MSADRWYLLYFTVLLMLVVILRFRGGCTEVSLQAVAAGALTVVILALIQTATVLGTLPEDSRERMLVFDLRLYVIYIASHILLVKSIYQGFRQICRG